MVPVCPVASRDFGRAGSELTSECRGFCKRWQQKWFLSASSPWDYAGEDYINWLGVVADLGNLARLMLGYGRNVICR